MVSYDEFSPSIASVSSGCSVNTGEHHPHHSHATVVHVPHPLSTSSSLISSAPSSSSVSMPPTHHMHQHHSQAGGTPATILSSSPASVPSSVPTAMTVTGSNSGSSGSFRGTNSLRSGNLKRSHLSRSRSGGIFSNPFRSDRDKMEQLTEILNQYSVHGIPEQKRLLFNSSSLTSRVSLESSPTASDGSSTTTSSSNVDSSSIQDGVLYLEENWRDIVSHHDNLDKRSQGQQDALWELLSTEVFYIKRLKVVTDLFLSCLCNLQSEALLNDVDTEKMFSNISDVYNANHEFWISHLLPMLNSARATRRKLDPTLMAEGFARFQQIFEPYIKYCQEHSRCQAYAKEKNKENELFKAYIVWCETQKDCERLRLMDLLVEPMQRLTKYSLLLKAILKKTDNPIEADALKKMNESVVTFVHEVEATLTRKQEQDRLAWIASRIESYDVIDINSGDEFEKVAKDYCKLDFLTQPMLGCKSNQMRQLLMEGSNVKLKDSGTSGKIDVYLFLFTDLLLICKKSSVGKKSSHVDKVKVIRPPFLVDRLIPANNITEVSTSSTSGSGGEKSSHHTSSSHHHHHSSSSFSSSIANQLSMIYLNEFGVVSSMFILFTSDARSWLEQLKKAQTKYSEAKQRASHSLFITGHQASSMSSMSIQTPFIYRSTTTDEDDESLLYDHPQQILLLTSGYSPRSSRSSLFHSHSGSVEMPGSEGPSIMGSNLMLQVPPPAAPPQTPTNVVNVSQYNQHLLTATGTLTSCYSISSQQPSRARSFELGELRNPSLSVDAEAFGRSHSMETRGSPSHHVVSVVTSSTNNTGLLSTAKLLSTSNTSTSGGGCNNQQSSPPTQLQQQSSFSSSPSSTRISVKPPPPKVPPRKPLGSGAGSLQRCISPIKKPPLLKTKNIEPSPLQSSASLQHSASSASTTTGSSIQQHSPTEKIIIKKEE